MGQAESLVTSQKDQSVCLAADQHLLRMHFSKAADASFLMLILVWDGFSTKMIQKPLYFFLNWFDMMLPFSHQCQAMGLGLTAYFLPSGVLWNNQGDLVTIQACQSRKIWNQFAPWRMNEGKSLDKPELIAMLDLHFFSIYSDEMSPLNSPTLSGEALLQRSSTLGESISRSEREHTFNLMAKRKGRSHFRFIIPYLINCFSLWKPCSSVMTWQWLISYKYAPSEKNIHN